MSITLDHPNEALIPDSGTLAITGNESISGLTAKAPLYADANKIITSLPLTNGQLVVGSTGAIPVAVTLTGTTNRVTVTNGAGSITLSGPQDLATTSTPTFAGETLTGLLDISNASAGQIKFPSSPNLSSDAHTIDAYEEGTWTPSVTFATPGDLSLSGITVQGGDYLRVGKWCISQFSFIGVATFTTASGNLLITGLPFTTVTSNTVSQGGCRWSNITKAGYTDITSQPVPTSTNANFNASGSGVGRAPVTAANVTSGGTLDLEAGVNFIIA
jgi:hypothetical protein